MTALTVPVIIPMSADAVLLHASKALGKIDLYGSRGVSMVTFQETEAMALLLALFGVVPSRPDQAAPAKLFIPPISTL